MAETDVQCQLSTCLSDDVIPQAHEGTVWEKDSDRNVQRFGVECNFLVRLVNILLSNCVIRSSYLITWYSKCSFDPAVPPSSLYARNHLRNL